MLERKLKMGLVGGGPGSFIAAVHYKAAVLDGKIEMVAGAFSRDPEKSKQTGREWHLQPGRVYSNYQDMIAQESALPQGERIDFVTISTPNNTHFPIARDFLQAGFHVMCEKPMTFNADEARELQALVRESGLIFGLMHNYTGYPMIKLARDLIRNGAVGEIRKIQVQYLQGWLSTPLEQTGQRQAGWRTDPAQSGAAGALGDIGTHAANLAETITGLQITHVCADIHTFVPGRRLDDDAAVLLRFEQGARGTLQVSQVCAGEENGLQIRIYGSQAGLVWRQEQPDVLHFKPLDEPERLYRRGNDTVAKISPAAARASRIPPGHPEGFIEAFANVYQNFADTLIAKLSGREANTLIDDFPGVDDGRRGMLFIETVLASSQSERKWLEMPQE